MATHREIELRPHSSAPALARKIVYDLCGEVGLPNRTASAAALVAGELVLTSIRQTRRNLDVSIDFAGDQVTVRVSDRSTAPPLLGRDTRTGPARSTALVERLASSWGYSRRESGNEVWALLRARS
jgi:hypothetical protein